MNWESFTVTDTTLPTTLTLLEAVHADATTAVLVFLNAAKWDQSAVLVAGDQVQLSGPGGGWAPVAGDVIEVGYWPETGPSPLSAASGRFEWSFRQYLEPVQVFTPSRASNATSGQNDPTYTLVDTVSAVFEELDGEAQVRAFGALIGRAGRIYAKDTWRDTLDTGNLVVRSGGDVYRIVVPASVPNPAVIDHCETLLEWLSQPPVLGT